MFDREQFVADCQTAIQDKDTAQLAVRDLVARAIENPLDLEELTGDPRSGPMKQTWHRSEELTVLHIIWPPEVELFAHDHNMWATIGVYGGREDNHFFLRQDDGSITRSGGKTLGVSDSVMLGSQVVHSVANPTRQWTAALHVYGGAFFDTPRNLWMAKNLAPVAFDIAIVDETLDAAKSRAIEFEQLEAVKHNA